MKPEQIAMVAGAVFILLIGMYFLFSSGGDVKEAADKAKKVGEDVKEKISNVDLKKAVDLKEKMDDLEDKVLGFKVKKGVSIISDFLVDTVNEVQAFSQTQACAVINGEAMNEIEGTIGLAPVPCKGEGQTIENLIKMVKAETSKMKEEAKQLSEPLQKLSISILTRGENTIDKLNERYCGGDQNEIQKETVLEIIRKIRESFCGHVEDKLSKEEYRKLIEEAGMVVNRLFTPMGMGSQTVEQGQPVLK